MSEFVWEPSAERVEQANVVRLWRKLGCASYHELHRLSVQEPDRFWRAVRDDLPVNGVYRAGSDHRKDGEAVGW